MIKVYACMHTAASKKIAAKFNDPDEYQCIRFSDGEMEVHYNESIRGSDVFLIQSVTSSDAFLELLLAINAAKLASAKSVTAVVPYLGYARQDRKSRPRVSIGAKVVLQAIERAGASRIITMDMHASQEVGFVDIPVDHLQAASIFVPYLQSKMLEDTVVVAPDAGAAKNVTIYSKALGLPMVLCYKQRSGINFVEEMFILGNVSGKRCIIIDDMADTAGTLCRCSNLLIDSGATSVTVMFTHPVLSGEAVYRLIGSESITEVITTNSIDKQSELAKIAQAGKLVRVLDDSELFAKTIAAAYNGESIESLFIKC